MTNQPQHSDLLEMASDIMSAYAGRNQLNRDELVDLIASVHGILSELSGQAVDPDHMGEELASDKPPIPAVPIDQSVTHDAIICLEDGRAFKTLKRHLKTSYGMFPDEYRVKWGLSKDYPMVAPSYSKRRSDTAKAIGLGRKPASHLKA